MHIAHSNHRRPRGPSKLFRVAIGAGLRSETVGVFTLRDAWSIARAHLELRGRAPEQAFITVSAALLEGRTWVYPEPGRWVRAWARIEPITRVDPAVRGTARRKRSPLKRDLRALLDAGTPTAPGRSLPDPVDILAGVRTSRGGQDT